MLDLKSKYFISGKLKFSTAFHIGSGKAGEGKVDSGILKDFQGKPILPGSSLKGSFRALAEKISHSLDQTACFLDMKLVDNQDFECVNGVSNQRYKELKEKINNNTNPFNYMLENNYLCDVCKLFGSKMHASRIFFSDGLLELSTFSDVTYVRDGVVIDRDTETARDGLKYDFEVAPENTTFNIKIELENPSESEIKLVQAVLTLWQEQDFTLGGNSSRGLGRVRLNNLDIRLLDFTNKNNFASFIKNKTKDLPKIELSVLV